MGTGFRKSLGAGSGLGKVHFGDVKNLDSLSLSTSIIAAGAKGRISPPDTPEVVSSTQSRQTSMDHISDVAPEIIVWTEDMDLDSTSQHDSDDLSDMNINEE